MIYDENEYEIEDGGIEGGQGRSASQLRRDGDIIVWAFVAFVVCGLVWGAGRLMGIDW